MNQNDQVEIMRPIKDYEDYLISESGVVMNNKTKRILK